MMMRRLAPVVLLAVLLGGVAARWMQPSIFGQPVGSNGQGAMTYARPKAVSVANGRSPDFSSPVLTSRRAGAAVLSSDAAALLSEQIALQQLASETSLHLTPAQWSAFAAVALDYQAVRQAYEASIASANRLQPGTYRLEIPAYPAAGDALRANFYADLRGQVGATAADFIAEKLGVALEGRFAGFGLAVQTLEFTADGAGAEAEYQVTRTVKFWDSVTGAARLTTRRETHFPGLEDPSGHTWGPFLALLAARVGDSAGS